MYFVYIVDDGLLVYLCVLWELNKLFFWVLKQVSLGIHKNW